MIKMIKMKFHLIVCVALIVLQSCTTKNAALLYTDQYNVVWDSQSENSGESMPVVGGDIGCNVWVENGDILFYMSRSGSLSENGTYFKLGRVRIQLSPNPFANSISFRQELILKDGYVEIMGEGGDNEVSLNARIRVWIEVHNQVIHIDIEANKHDED